MTLEDLIRRFRLRATDVAEPHLFADQDVIDWLNDAEEQACVRGRLISEDELEAVCSIPLTPGTHTYALNPLVYEIISLWIKPASGRKRPVTLRSREWLDHHLPEWRESTRPAEIAIQDDTTVRIVGAVEAGDTLELECYRLPRRPMANDTDKPEIHLAHHQHLIDWALHRAFSVPDAETFDQRRADLAERAFTEYFGLLPDADMRRITRHDVVHHNRVHLP